EWRTITVATSALQSQYDNDWSWVMAGTTLALLPLVILMIVFQKQITRSVGETTLRGRTGRGRAGPGAAGRVRAGPGGGNRAWSGGPPHAPLHAASRHEASRPRTCLAT